MRERHNSPQGPEHACCFSVGFVCYFFRVLSVFRVGSFFFRRARVFSISLLICGEGWCVNRLFNGAQSPPPVVERSDHLLAKNFVSHHKGWKTGLDSELAAC